MIHKNRILLLRARVRDSFLEVFCRGYWEIWTHLLLSCKGYCCRAKLFRPWFFQLGTAHGLSKSSPFSWPEASYSCWSSQTRWSTESHSNIILAGSTWCRSGGAYWSILRSCCATCTRPYTFHFRECQVLGGSGGLSESHVLTSCRSKLPWILGFWGRASWKSGYLHLHSCLFPADMSHTEQSRSDQRPHSARGLFPLSIAILWKLSGLT